MRPYLILTCLTAGMMIGAIVNTATRVNKMRADMIRMEARWERLASDPMPQPPAEAMTPEQCADYIRQLDAWRGRQP